MSDLDATMHPQREHRSRALIVVGYRCPLLANSINQITYLAHDHDLCLLHRPIRREERAGVTRQRRRQMTTARFAVACGQGGRGRLLAMALVLSLCLQLLCLGPGARVSAFLSPVGTGYLTQRSGPIRGRWVAAPSFLLKASLDFDSRTGAGEGPRRRRRA